MRVENTDVLVIWRAQLCLHSEDVEEESLGIIGHQVVTVHVLLPQSRLREPGAVDLSDSAQCFIL